MSRADHHRQPALLRFDYIDITIMLITYSHREGLMPEKDQSNRKKPGESFGDMFEAFGVALGQIFNDPELKAKARDFGQSAARSAQTFAGRFKDEDVKAKFREAGKAAEDFGRSVAESFKGEANKTQKTKND